ncbi:hypothetical protein B0H13DRAFT_1850332 [Mycena leptocephala]|nr:hypothetical protein B0H13DRAFT_1850332 [Mycena leptocephala]
MNLLLYAWADINDARKKGASASTRRVTAVPGHVDLSAGSSGGHMLPPPVPFQPQISIPNLWNQPGFSYPPPPPSGPTFQPQYSVQPLAPNMYGYSSAHALYGASREMWAKRAYQSSVGDTITLRFKVLHEIYGKPKEVTIQIIRWQVWNACAGNNKALDASYSQTGIKDKISQYWIQKVLDMGKERRGAALSDPKTRNPQLNLSSLKGEARKALKDEISRTIQLDLWNWVVQQPPENFVLLDEHDPARSDLRPGIHFNILLQTRGIDPHRDTPAEILHTYLLGNDKYVWHDTTKQWDGKREEIFAARLAASSITGLSIPPPRAR